MNTFTKKHTDLLLLCCWPLMSAAASLWLHAQFLTSTLLFFGVPCFYLSLRRPQILRSVPLFSVILGLPLAIILEYVAERTHIWSNPQSVFGSFRFFDFVSVDVIVWVLLFTYIVIAFYETFVDAGSRHRMHIRTMRMLVRILAAAFLLFLCAYLFAPHLLSFPYSYVVLGMTVGLLPTLVFLGFYHPMTEKFFRTSLFFIPYFIIYELTALKLGQWEFPTDGQFLAVMPIFGSRIPLEEFVFWVLFGAAGVLTYFEYFFDDRR